MSQYSSITDVDVPDDFPLELLNRFNEVMVTCSQSNNAAWGHWAHACNAVHYRFLACADADEAFRRSINAAGASPLGIERMRQEQALFAFFTSGQSALECLGYGLNFVGKIVDPFAFALAANRVSFSKVADTFGERFANEQVTLALAAVKRSEEIREWKVIRDILLHRESPGRAHYSGTSPKEYPEATWGLMERPLVEAETSERRAWLANSMTAILDGANDFAATHL